MLLDLGALADRHGFASLGAFALSPNQRMLAYTLDTSGAEESFSPLHLPYISPISPAAGELQHATSPLYLPHTSRISPL